MRAIWVGCLLMAMTAPAGAAVSVFGSSLARECFESAQLGTDSFGLESCDRALKQEQLTQRDRAATLVNRGIILNRTRKLDAALADFEAALKLDPDLAEAYLNRGNTYFFRREFESAIGDYSRAIELETADPHVSYYNRALVHEVLKDYKRARADLEEALRIAPEFAQARERMAILEKLDQPESESGVSEESGAQADAGEGAEQPAN